MVTADSAGVNGDRGIPQQSSECYDFSLQHYDWYHFALRNGPFRLMKRTVPHSKTDRFVTQNRPNL